MTNFFQNLPIPKELRDALNSETSTEDGSGGVSAAPRTAKFIVGNELAGAYVEAVLTDAEIRANYYAMQRGGSLAPTASGTQFTSIYNVYNNPTANGITDLLAVGGAFTAVDPIGVDELRIM